MMTRGPHLHDDQGPYTYTCGAMSRYHQLLPVTSENQVKMDKGIFMAVKRLKSQCLFPPPFGSNLEYAQKQANNRIKNSIEPKEREAKSDLFDIKTSLIGLTVGYFWGCV